MFLFFTKAHAYQPLTDIGDFGKSIVASSGGALPANLEELINFAFYVMIAVAVVLAIFGVIRGGYVYLTSGDNGDNKSRAKRILQASVGGLLLALGSWLILNTINPKILVFDPQFSQLDRAQIVDLGIYKDMTEEQIKSVLEQNNGNLPTFASEEERNSFISSINNIAKRQTDGGLNITSYWNGDTNTNERRGNADNLLTPGSVALSGDLIAAYKKAYGKSLPVGSQVFINGTSVGYYEDTAGVKEQWSNTVDIYDPQRKFGSAGILKGFPKGSYKLSFGSPRAQTANPSNK